MQDSQSVMYGNGKDFQPFALAGDNGDRCRCFHAFFVCISGKRENLQASRGLYWGENYHLSDKDWWHDG